MADPVFDPRRISYQSQGPGQAFTRYLAGLQGNQQFTSPIRSLLENRGAYQSILAPLFGYGIGEDIGGRGQDFAPFFQSQQGQQLRYADIQRQLRQAQEAVNSGGGAGPYLATLAGRYENPQDQLRAVQAGLGTQVNPYFQSGLTSLLGRQFEKQQALDENQSFFDYARQRGYF